MLNRVICVLSSILMMPFVLIVACGGEKGPTGLDLSQVDYFPLEIGNTWKYESRERDITQIESHTVTGEVILRKATWFVIDETDTVRVNALGEYVTYKNGVETIQYKMKAEVGETWTLGVDDEGNKILGALVSRTETVEVPAGTFDNCLKFKFFQLNSGKLGEIYHWLAPNVGFIKKRALLEENLYSVLLEATISSVTYPK